MSGVPRSAGHDRAARLRAAFDAAFADAPAPRPATEPLLLIAAAGMPAAVPLRECAAVQAAGTVTSLPAVHPAFLGLVGVGGAVLPLYDMARLLGLAAAGTAARRWLLVASGRDRVGFVVDAIQGYADVPLDPSRAHGTMVTAEGGQRRFVSLAALTGEIERALGDLAPTKELG